MAPEQNHRKCEKNEGRIAFDAPVASRKHMLELVEPGESTFNFPASGVTLQRSPVLHCSALPVSLMRCNHVNAALCEPLIERITVVARSPINRWGRPMVKASLTATSTRAISCGLADVD
jgi:hypothetical protein